MENFKEQVEKNLSAGYIDGGYRFIVNKTEENSEFVELMKKLFETVNEQCGDL